MDLIQLVTESLRRNEEFVLYRGEHSVQPASPSVLLLTPALMEPALETIKKIEHEYSLRDELDSAWAVSSPTNLGRSRSCSKILAVRLSIDFSRADGDGAVPVLRCRYRYRNRTQRTAREGADPQGREA